MEVFEWAGWSRIIILALFSIWLFSFLLWDFILAVIKQYELMRNGEANVFDFKREVQCFVGMCVLIGWGLYSLYGWFEEPQLGTWLVGGAVGLVAVWFNRMLNNKWLATPWKPAKPQGS